MGIRSETEVVRQRLFISHGHKEQRSIVSEYAVKSLRDDLTNIIFLSRSLLPNLIAKDEDGSLLPVMATKDVQTLIGSFIDELQGAELEKLRDVQERIRSGKLHVIWIRLPKDKAINKNEVRTLTLIYSPQRKGESSSLAIKVKPHSHPLYYTLLAPDDFDFKKVHLKNIEDGKTKVHDNYPEHMEEFRTYNSRLFRIRENLKDRFEIAYSFRPTPAASTPTKMGLWTLVALAAATLLFKHVLVGVFGHVPIATAYVEIGLFTIGGSLLLPQLTNNMDVRGRYTRWYVVPIILGVLILL